MRYVLIGMMLSAAAVDAAEPKVLAEKLKNPMSACYGPKDSLYVTEMGDFDSDADGRILIIENGKVTPFATGLNDPTGIVYARKQNLFYVVDKSKILKVDAMGRVTTLVTADKFPNPLRGSLSIALDDTGTMMLVSDRGTNNDGGDGTIYQIELKSGKIDVVASTKTVPGMKLPKHVVYDGVSQFLFADVGTGLVHRVNLTDLKATTIAEGLKAVCGLVWDRNGRLLIACSDDHLFAIPRPGMKPVQGTELPICEGCCLHANGTELIVTDAVKGRVLTFPTAIPGWEVDETPLAIEMKPAFPNLKWTDWDDGSESGKVIPLRPIVLTHANDDSHRNFVLLQHGYIHSFDNSDAVTKTKVFLDISKKVRYVDKQNEEGALGLAFHPQFKTNGEFFVFYTPTDAKLTNILSRFKVKKEDPTVADPASEEVLLKITKPYWNHDGGTIAFGPDGFLYMVHGDGGLGNDPHENGQNLKTHLGKMLRIDVDHKADGKNYSVPADNPYLKTADALPEIYAYGLRNPWRFSFDRKTGQLWLADVGQGLFEEINHITAGGNYGWSVREGLHPFGKKGTDVRKDLVDPIWEYSHDVGKSITGGHVYRGKQIPELDGAYLHADYVSPKLWALRYDAAKGRVTHNQMIAAPPMPVMSFGEDEAGESYILGAIPKGHGIYRFTKAAK
ncbi:hypothetical protein BH11PLA2_BH11PLA2_49800 [soil metagenome]